MEPVWVRDLSFIETQLLFSPQFTELAGIDREELLHMVIARERSSGERSAAMGAGLKKRWRKEWSGEGSAHL